MKTTNPINLRLIAYALAAITLLVNSGCFRYVPSRSELEKSSPASTAGIGGETEFFAYESDFKQRLNKFIAQRKELAASQVISSYKIGAGDLIEFKVYDQPDMNSVERVTPEGFISLPLIEDINIAGLTLSEARGAIEEKLQKFIRRPQIQLLISEYEAHKVSVVGAVATPGVYPLKRNDYTLLELLSKAGGRTPTASSRVIIIPAANNNLPAPAELESIPLASLPPEFNQQPRAQMSKMPASPPRIEIGVEIDLDELLGGSGSIPLNIPLASGDTIVVPEAGRIEVDGEVIKPGSYSLGSRSSMLAAIAAAGGLTYSANINEIELIRDVGNNNKASLVLNLEEIALYGRDDVRLRDGDFIRVPSESGRFRQRQVVEVINSVFNVGVGANIR